MDDSIACIRINNNRKEIRDINDKVLCRYRPSKKAHDKSLILLKSPWTVLPIYGKDVKILDKNIKVISLSEMDEYVDEMISLEEYEENLWNWTVNIKGEDFHERSYGDEPGTHHICFNVADYISYLWGVPVTSEKNKYFTTWESLLNEKGVFWIETDNGHESHAFVMWIRDRDLILYQGYGGLERPYIIERDKKDFLNDIIALEEMDDLDQQKELLLELFNFPVDIFNQSYGNIDEPLEFKREIKVYRIA